MTISKEELHMINGDTDWIEEHGEGYRIVYFFEDGKYSVGEFCKTIEGFMIGFAEAPINDEEDIPKFISSRDLLSKYLKYNDKAIAVAIYQTNGDLVERLQREDFKKCER